MKYLFSTAVSCCFLVLVASTVFAGEQTWSFESEAEDWKPANGSWSVEDGIYKLAKGGRAEHSLVGDAAWEDYTVEAKVRLDEGNWAGVVYRAQSEMEYYVYYLNVPNNKTELWRHKTGHGMPATRSANSPDPTSPSRTANGLTCGSSWRAIQ